MAINIRPIKRLHGPNPGGLASILLLPADKIISTAEWWWNGEVNEDPVLEEGTECPLFWVSDLGGELEVNEKITQAGPGYELQAEFPYIAPASERASMGALRGRPCVLLTTNLQGERHLVGTKDRPLLPDIRRSSGSISGMYGYRFRYYGMSLLTPPLYTGELAGGIVEQPQEPAMKDFSSLDFSHYDFY